MQKTIVSILGRPLSGKDTQAAQLAKELPNAIAMSTGEIIREVKATGSTHRFWPILGPHIPTMDAGVLIPEEAVDVVFEMVAREQFARGVETIIVTAHPRMPKELDDFDRFTKEEGVKALFVNLKTSESYMYAVHGVRDVVRVVAGRVDDGVDKLSIREQEFVNHTQPVLDRLREEGRLIEVNAERPIPEVQRDLQAVLRHLFLDREVRLPVSARR